MFGVFCVVDWLGACMPLGVPCVLLMFNMLSGGIVQ
jgi:hypothetical protein